MRRKKNLVRLMLTLIPVTLILLSAMLAPYLCPFDPDAQDLASSLLPPGGRHLLGTDLYGRDLFSRVIAGGRISILSTLVLVGITALAGTAAGVLSGFMGGWIDALIMRISDLFLAFPGLVFAMALAAVLHGGVWGAVISLALVNWPKYARVARSETLTVRKQTYIEAARLSGDSSLQLIFRHILPNIAGPLLVTATLDIGTMMMELAGLAFLGLGAQPPAAEWGNMMSDGRSLLQTYPWIVLAPGFAIFLTVAAFNLMGDALRDYLDPTGVTGKRRGRRRKGRRP
jgi:peptide/nickel transport system permease protein